MAVLETWKHSGVPTMLLFCLEADVKPTIDIRGEAIPTGSECIETDTGCQFVYTGSAWIESDNKKSFREVKAQKKQSWLEHLFIDVGNDLTDDIDTTYVTLSKIDVHTTVGSNTLALISSTGFTGNMYTTYWIEVTKAGAMSVAEFKWRWRTLLGGANAWSDYTTKVITSASNDLGNNIKLNWTGITSVVGDIYLVHGMCSWHTPADGANSFLTSFAMRMYDANKSAKVAYMKLNKNNWHIWELLDNEFSSAYWRTPIHILGDGSTKQFKIEVKEAVKADIEYVYLIMKGWDE